MHEYELCMNFYTAVLNTKHNELIKILSVSYSGTGKNSRIWHSIPSFQVHNGFIKPDNNTRIYGIDGGAGGFTSFEDCDQMGVTYYCILIGKFF